MVSPIVDLAAIAYCHKEIDSLCDRLRQLEKRKDDLLRMQRRLSDFQSAQCNQAEAFSASFAGVRFASHLASQLRETVGGPSFLAADSQVSTAVRKAFAEIDDTEDQIQIAKRRLAILQAGG